MDKHLLKFSNLLKYIALASFVITIFGYYILFINFEIGKTITDTFTSMTILFTILHLFIYLIIGENNI